MRVSYRWLERHVDLSGIPPEEVAAELTLHTAEVEGVERFAPHLDDVVVGRVVEREPHPDADKLSVCRVEVGDGAPLGIVCGAPNVAAGQRVAVARVGTVLPGDLRIQKAKIRGVASAGMICSERELDLGDEHEGIWVLPEDSAVGAPVAEAVGLADWVLEIDNKAITHRPDLWGHRGIAAEIAAIRERELRPLDTSLPPAGSGAPFPVRIESARCFRYLALPIDGVAPGRSPAWMRHLLLAVGQRPIELTVDVSNFVMLDLGQPNHLFDRERISAAEGGIVVRDAREDEVLETLDGVERRLSPDDLLICSGDEPVALAGVMGGEATKVGAGTRSLLLEVASFDATTVRRTAARLALRTEASARFEKHLDPTLPLRAAGHLVRLLAELQPGLSLPAPPTDAGDWQDPALTVTLRPERARAVLGVELPDDAITGSLARLGFEARPTERGLAVGVPSWRASRDVAIEEDLIEEVGRLHGYDRVPERALVSEVAPVPADDRRAIVRAIQRRLSGGARFHEVLAYTYLPEDLARATGCAELPHVEAVNAVSDGWQRIRRSVVPSLLGFLEPNLRLREVVQLFEVGKGTLPEHADERGLPREIHEAGLVRAAPRPAKGARFDAGALSRLRAVVDDLLRHLGVPSVEWRRAEEAERPSWAHPGRAAVAAAPRKSRGDGAALALVAALEPEVVRALGVEADAAAAAVSIDALIATERPGASYRPVPRYPGVKVDVALAVPAETPAAEVRGAIARAGKGLVEETELFDLYRGEQVGAGRKSLAWHVVLRAADRTLAEKDEQRFLARLEKEAGALGGELRRE